MKDLNIVFAGFGGQGILFAGKVVAYAGLIEGRELSWLPSYGPEMRGGTANCSICLSDEPIGSPLVTNPNVLIAMNRPSLDKFVNEVEPGGTILLDSSLIDERVERFFRAERKLLAQFADQDDVRKALQSVFLRQF